MIDIKGLDRVDVLLALVRAAIPRGVGALIGDDLFDEQAYDRDHDNGACARVIAALRANITNPNREVLA